MVQVNDITEKLLLLGSCTVTCDRGTQML
jgi:hypothetical protein